MDKMNLPSNSHKSKEERKKIGPVITGSVIEQKKGFLKQFREAFTNSDKKTITSYILYDVVVPATKNLMYDVVSGGFEMLLFGSRKSDRILRNKGISYVNYSTISRQPVHQETPHNQLRSTNFDGKLLFSSKVDAENVLTALTELIDVYNMVSLADLYELIGKSALYTDYDWGWRSVSTARVERVRDGWLLMLPTLQSIT